MKKEVVFILVILFMNIIISGCSSNVKSITKSFENLDYEIKDCSYSENKDETLSISFEENKIIINQIKEVNCCSDIELKYKVTDSIIRLYQDFSGEECDCLCKKEITAEISLRDITEIEFYSRENEEYPYDLLMEKFI